MIIDIPLIKAAKSKYTIDPEGKIVSPWPGGQTKYLQSTAFELLFGGAAGPGKTFDIVIDALGLQFKGTALDKYAIEIPEYRAVLFRRKTTQLADLIEEAKNYYWDFNGMYVASRRGDPGPSFNFPKFYSKGGTVYKTYTEGARIFLCHMNEERDKENHHGFEYQFIGFDELTQFLFSQYIYLFSRARSTVEGLWPRVRATTNPVGIGLRWVKKRFDPKHHVGEIKYFIADPKDEKNFRGIETTKDHPDALSRQYLPGKLQENQTLMRKDPKYASRIKAMGPKIAKALLESDWDVMEGQFFIGWNAKIHVIKSKYYLNYEHIRQFEILGIIDYGTTMVLSLIYKDQYGRIVLFDQLTSINEARQIRVSKVKKYLAERKMSNILVVGDTDMWLPDAYDLANQESASKAFIDAGIHLVKVRKQGTDQLTYRIACNRAMDDLLYYEVGNDGLITKQPNVKIYERCSEFIDTFPALPADENNAEDTADVDFDHWWDSFKMGMMIIRETKTTDNAPKEQWLREMLGEIKKTKQNFMTK